MERDAIAGINSQGRDKPAENSVSWGGFWGDSSKEAGSLS